LKLDKSVKSDGYDDFFAGAPPSTDGESTIDKQGFVQVDPIIAIAEGPGDTLIKGFHNNDIALSYNIDGAPIISIIVNRAVAEYDMNTSGVHIYGLHDVDSEIQYSDVVNNNVPEEGPDEFLVLNANKVRINAKAGTIYISGENTAIVGNRFVAIDAGENFFVNTPKAYIGQDAEEPFILGNQLLSVLEQILDAIVAQTHGTPVGPSTPPVNVAVFKQIKSKLNKILSRQNFTK
jgi:hypothetical protein